MRRGEILMAIQRRAGRLVAGVALVLSCTPAFAQAAAEPICSISGRFAREERLTTILGELAQRYRQSGFSVVVSDGANPPFYFNSGYADREAQTTLNEHSRYQIASVTKPITATLIMQLVENGRIQLDGPICPYIENCPRAWRQVTIRQLLNHRSGIPEYLPQWAGVPEHRLQRSPAELLASIRERALDFPPGSQLRYGNSAYLILGLILERVYGSEYADIVRDQLFRRAGMLDSGYERPGEIIAHRVRGYARRGGEVSRVEYVDPSWGYAAAGLYSSSSDLLRFTQALWSGSLINQSTLDTMLSPRDTFGLGWMARRENGDLTFLSMGVITGFEGEIRIIPARRLTIIVLTNGQVSASGIANLVHTAFGSCTQPD